MPEIIVVPNIDATARRWNPARGSLECQVTARADLETRGLTTAAWYRIAEAIPADAPFDAAFIDESQDLSVAELRFLAALGGAGAELFFAGDIGQRIFRQPFSWHTLGVDIRGRSCVLKVNYRTSEQIRRRADRLLPGVISDGDGAEEDRRGVVSVFGAPQPETFEAGTEEKEIAHVARWLSARIVDGIEPDEISVFARTDDAAERWARAFEAADIPFRRGVPGPQDDSRMATVCSMAMAKGLEFSAVAVAACDEGLLPLSERLALASSAPELRETYETERHLLYVAITRAREYPLACCVTPVSGFVAELAAQA